MRIWRVLAILAVLSIASVHGAGKSDRKRKKHIEEEEERETVSDGELSITTEYPTESLTKNSILSGHEQVDFEGERNFDGPMLAYVTPWNSKGYDLAKWTAHKLTHVSPVWFQLKPITADHSESCRLEGMHDVDQDWISAIRQNNSDIKIVPRVIFEDWPAETLMGFLSADQWNKRCLRELANYAQKTGFDGIVLELWMSTMITFARIQMSQGQRQVDPTPFLVEMFTAWGQEFREREMQLIAPVPAPLSGEYQVSGVIHPRAFMHLASAVDYVQVMTYDFPSRQPAGVAPLDWIAKSVDVLLEEAPSMADRLMIGLNFYGYEYGQRGPEAVKYDRFLEILKDKSLVLEWDAEAKEHRLTTGSSLTYYPSQASIDLRLKLAKKYGVGAAIWDFGQGLNYFTKVL